MISFLIYFLNQIYVFSVYPNPNSGAFTVNVDLNQKKNIDLKFTNLLGNEVLLQKRILDSLRSCGRREKSSVRLLRHGIPFSGSLLESVPPHTCRNAATSPGLSCLCGRFAFIYAGNPRGLHRKKVNCTVLNFNLCSVRN